MQGSTAGYPTVTGETNQARRDDAARTVSNGSENNKNKVAYAAKEENVVPPEDFQNPYPIGLCAVIILAAVATGLVVNRLFTRSG
jgi:hypothetical protein